jgi:hypothetical protein
MLMRDVEERNHDLEQEIESRNFVGKSNRSFVVCNQEREEQNIPFRKVVTSTEGNRVFDWIDSELS